MSEQQYSHTSKPVGTAGIWVGDNDSEVQVASSAGQVYQQGTAITASAAEINQLDDFFTATAATTGTAIANKGFYTVASTGGTLTFTLATPTAGVASMVDIFCTSLGSTAASCTIKVASTATTTVDGTNVALTFGPAAAAGQKARLRAGSTTRWYIMSSTADLTSIP